eukprot:scaffold7052_cov254-Pinguiococcus_pyrenoidosus.AAC.25
MVGQDVRAVEIHCTMTPVKQTGQDGPVRGQRRVRRSPAQKAGTARRAAPIAPEAIEVTKAHQRRLRGGTLGLR